MVTSPKECTQEYIKCLSRLLSLSPSFSIPAEIHGGSSSIEVDQELKAWCEAPVSSVVYLNGQPGVGKSVFSSLLLRKLRTLQKANHERGSITYYSFSELDGRRTSSIALLSSLIRQIISQDPEDFGQIRDLYLAIERQSSWTSEALWILYQSLLAARRQGLHFCIVNNIHSCDMSRTRFLARLVNVQRTKRLPTSLKVILIGELRQDILDLSKTYPTIQLNVKASLKKSIQAHIEQFIANLMEERPFLLKFEHDLKEKLYKCENFVQLSVTLDILMERKNTRFSTQKAVRSELQALPYDISNQINIKAQQLPAWARKALGWILHAQRPMGIDELAAVLALVESEKTLSFDRDELLFCLPADTRQALDPLLKVENNEVCWKHELIKHRFNQVIAGEQEQIAHRSEAEDPAQSKTQHLNHWRITCILLKYLGSEFFINPIEQALKEDTWIRPQGEMFAMMDYAVQFWPAHYRKAKEQGSHAEAVFGFLENKRLIRVWWELNSRLGSMDLPPDLSDLHPLLLATHLGFPDVVDFCLEVKKPEGVPFATRGPAVALASWAGHLDIITKVFDDDFDKETADDARYLTEALINASNRGHEEIVAFLIGHIPKPTDKFIWDPIMLCRAAEIGYETLVKMLTTAGAAVDIAHEGSTPLQYAAKNGHELIVECLLSLGADVNSEAAEDSFKPCLHAANKGYTVVVQILMQYKVDIRQSNTDGQTALHLAAQNGHIKVTELLLEHAPDVAARDRMGRTALHLASLNGHEKVVEVLIQFEPNPGVDILDDDNNTPLTLASQRGHSSAVEYLLQRGATVDVTGIDGHTALYGAAANGHETTAEMILQSRYAIKAQFADINGVLLEAARCGFHEVCKRCLQITKNDIINSSSREKWTALHHAAQNGYDDIVILLLDNGSDIESETDEGKTPLAVAAVAFRLKVVLILLTRGADPSKKNLDGQNLVSELAELPQQHSVDDYIGMVRALLQAGIATNDVDHAHRSALHHAVRTGNARLVEELLKVGADPRLQDYISWTPLHYAVLQGIEFSRLLLHYNADPQICDDDGWTPFHIAAQYGRADVMEVLSKAARDVIKRRSNDGSTPLHFAIEEASVEWLLTQDININAMDQSGKTALMTAARLGSDKVVGLLLSHKADPQLRDNSGKTALHHAAKKGSVPVAQKLLEKDNSLLNYINNKQRSALHVAIQRKRLDFVRMLLLQQPHIDIDLQDKDGNTPLLLAVSAGREMQGFVQLLTEAGPDTELRNKVGQTALLVAVGNGNEELWRLLLDMPNGSKIDADGEDYPTALHVAAEEGEIGTIEQLLNRGANVNAKGGLFHTALQAAAVDGYDNVVEYLLEKGADASLTGGLFGNALSAAVYSGTFNIVPKLHAMGAAINIKDDQGRTALHLAAWRGSWDTIKWLKNKGSDLNVKDHQGRTLLHHAATGRNPELVARLLKDEDTQHLNVEDIDGWTPLHWACRSEANTEVVRLLKHGTDFRQRTRDHWTPENISIFHDAKELLPIMSPAFAKSNQSRSTDNLIANEALASARNWTTGSNHWAYECDGCLQKVSRFI